MFRLALVVVIGAAVWGGAPEVRAQEGRAAVYLAEGDFADREGIGITAAYEFPVNAAGRGRFLAGPAARYLHALSYREAQEDCGIFHQDRGLSVSVRGRYVLDVHRRFRPWASVGVGPDWSRHDVFEDQVCGLGFEESETRIAPGFDVEAGFDVDVWRSSLVTLGVTAHGGGRNFVAIVVGAGWRF